MASHLDSGDLMLAAQGIYDFAWDDFCDWYIELSKGDLFGGEPERQAQVRGVLSHVLSVLLRLPSLYALSDRDRVCPAAGQRGRFLHAGALDRKPGRS